MELYEAKILIAGARALGAATAVHLAAAGAGYVAVADGAGDDGFNRAEVLAARLALLAPDLQVDPYPVAVEEANAVAITSGHDAVVDATGYPSAARLLSRAGAELGIPIVHFAHGGVLTTRPGVTACLACAEPETADGGSQKSELAPAERSLQAGLMGAVAATDLAVALREPPSEAVLRIVHVPPAIDSRSIARYPSCAVCTAVPEAAR